MKTIALRIDVDTYRGTKRGVPALCETLAQFGIAGTFFLDNIFADKFFGFVARVIHFS